ncbi:MAG: rod shape-determining protein MreD [Acidimicrobiaceae bacterium]|nr:rod shape-determining protein MreD [Acidimicrobiaceae bacterium]
MSDLITPLIKARVKILGLLLLGVLLQTTVASDLRVGGVAPDFMLLLAVCGGLAGGPEHGAFVGFFAGLLSDLLVTNTPLGLAALTYGIVGYGIGLLRANVLPQGRLLAPLMAVIGTAAGVVIYVGVGDLVGQHQLIAEGRSWLLRVALVEAVFNAVLSVPVSWLFDRAARGSKGAEELGADRFVRIPAR